MRKVSIEFYVDDSPRYEQVRDSFKVDHAIITCENGDKVHLTQLGDPSKRDNSINYDELVKNRLSWSLEEYLQTLRTMIRENDLLYKMDQKKRLFEMEKETNKSNFS